jgi:hypothetical protein
MHGGSIMVGLSVNQGAAMDETRGWGFSRYAALFVVLAFHLALFTALLLTTRSVVIPPAAMHAVEVVFLPTVTPPKVRSEIAAPRRFTGGLSASIALPVFAAGSASMSAPAESSSDGRGAGVDWAAEARRGVQAFEIRSQEPPSNRSVSGEPVEAWFRQLQHHTGERMKIPNGDWIVWINANCYRVATSGAGTLARGVVLPPMTCLDPPGTRHE